MKRWSLPILIGCLSIFTLGQDALGNQPLFRQEIAVSVVSQSSPTVMDRVWELIETARSSVKANQQDKAISLLSQAFELTQTLEDTNTRNPLLVKIIAEYGAIGAYEEAIARLSTLSYDQPLPDNQGYSLRMQGEVLLTRAYVNAQRYEQALQFAQNLELDAAKERALLAIVAGYARQGLFEKAIALSQRLQIDTYQQYLAVSAILDEYIQRNQYEQALAFVQTLANTENQDSIARSLAEAAWRTGRYNIALQSVQAITNQALKVQSLRSLAQALVSVGEKEQAAEIVSQAFELSKKTEEFLLFSWVKDFLATEQKEKVQAILNTLAGEEDSQMAYNRSLVVGAYLNVGRYADAFEFAKRIPDRVLLPLAEYSDPKVDLFYAIIQQSLQAGQDEFAKQVALTLTGKKDQVEALQTIASHAMETGKNEQAVTLLNQAQRIAKTIESISVVPERSLFWIEPNASLLIDIADDYITLDQKQIALETLDVATQSVQNFETQYAFDIPVWTKSKALHPIASRYLKLGEREKANELLFVALQDAQALKGNNYIIQELLATATAYAELGNLQQSTQVLEKTLPLLETVERQSEKLSLFITIANKLITQGNKERGLELLKTVMSSLETLETEQEQISLLIQMIGTYAAAGENSIASPLATQTLTRIQGLESEYERATKLEELAVASTQIGSPSLALEIVQKVSGEVDRARMLLAIAQKYAASGNTSLATEVLTQALAVADKIRDERQRDELLANTSASLVDFNNFYQNDTDDSWDYNSASKLATSISNPETKASLLIKLALKYSMSGETEASRQTLSAAFEVAKGMEEQLQWRTLRWEVMDTAMREQEYDFVEQIANEVEDTAYKATLLRQVAQQKAIAGVTEPQQQ
ncbi:MULTISPECIES: tetratricopeptide repeat protein [unclassified Coleofasciculus]|uniref:tetratricopeptide repeat protein n=1 Tax=unclassified Coleofasciculus TaxID=2692782 RepID=UPI00187DF23E|nr:MULTISPECIES: hypothetical protein [unclassified Coleofasciculus]MBE9125845.1 hypothetical protein [Coleofasciculus sp. LEGE 07081]MBE9149164.1 hypothetical protein [Coleofasciculus sp. LEGE 07092]